MPRGRPAGQNRPRYSVFLSCGCVTRYTAPLPRRGHCVICLEHGSVYVIPKPKAQDKAS